MEREAKTQAAGEMQKDQNSCEIPLHSPPNEWADHHDKYPTLRLKFSEIEGEEQEAAASEPHQHYLETI